MAQGGHCGVSDGRISEAQMQRVHLRADAQRVGQCETSFVRYPCFEQAQVQIRDSCLCQRCNEWFASAVSDPRFVQHQTQV